MEREEQLWDGQEMIKRAPKIPISNTEAGPLTVTVSVGAAVHTPGLDHVQQTLRRADHALYQAKNSGRDQVCVAAPR